MDISGARWGLADAEAILTLRALISNGGFDIYWTFHLAQEHRRVHASRYALGVIPAPHKPSGLRWSGRAAGGVRVAGRQWPGTVRPSRSAPFTHRGPCCAAVRRATVCFPPGVSSLAAAAMAAGRSVPGPVIGIRRSPVEVLERQIELRLSRRPQCTTDSAQRLVHEGIRARIREPRVAVRRADRREPALDRRDRTRASAKLAVRRGLRDDERRYQLRRHRQLVRLIAPAQVGAQRIRVGAVGTLRRARAAPASESPRGRKLARKLSVLIKLGVLIIRQAGLLRYFR
jgi:hypothetical protein